MRSPSPSGPVLEGVFAIDKPTAITSAQVIRDVQTHFHSSSLFAPWFARETGRKDAETHNQRMKRRKQSQPGQIKLGHGGTLDPLATGVLILGVGEGTKSLQGFLGCTKSYECVLLFGVDSDTYDTEGRVAERKPYEHVTRDKVEEVLGRYRGEIMQRPPLYSALRVNGKRLYDYAREGVEVPVEIQERPVEVKSLEITEWMQGGSHGYRWPVKETGDEVEEEAPRKKQKRGQKEKGVTEKVLKFGERSDADAAVLEPPKPVEEDANTSTLSDPATTLPPCPAPAVRLKMTVTSGFYVRSLCHDLGLAVNSAGLMASLVRTRQGDFELGTNVLGYDELKEGEDVWGPKVKTMLEDWITKGEGQEGEEVVARPRQQDKPRDRAVVDKTRRPAKRQVERNTSSDED